MSKEPGACWNCGNRTLNYIAGSGWWCPNCRRFQ